MAKKRIKNELSFIFGPEPDLENVSPEDKNYNTVLGKCLQWYGQYGGANSISARRKFHKAWLKEWAKANGIKSRSFAIPASGISSLGSLARLANRGFNLKESHIQTLKDAFASWKPVKKVPVDKKKQAKLLSIKAKAKHENSLKPIITIFDEAIDSVLDGAKTWSVNTSSPLNGKQSNELDALYSTALDELKAVYDKTDQELVDAYPYPRLVLRRLIQVHEDILAEVSKASLKGDVVRKARKVRKKTIKPKSSLVKNLQYAPVNSEYNLTSIDPEKVVGSSILYVFDTKKRLLKRYEALGVSGIEVTGTTLKNVKGVQKIIRKPEEQMAEFAPLPKLKSSKFFDEIRAVEKECTGRTNKDVILLKVF